MNSKLTELALLMLGTNDPLMMDATDDCINSDAVIDLEKVNLGTRRDLDLLFTNYELDIQSDSIPFGMNRIDQIEYPHLHEYLLTQGYEPDVEIILSVLNRHEQETEKCQCLEE